MAITKKKTDIAILGGGLSGLVVAACLEKAGMDYLVVDGHAEFGGMIKGQEEHGIWLDYGLKSVPVGEDLALNPLIKLKKLLELNLPIESWNSPPLTWGKNEFVEFVGFGETKSRTLIEELGYYTASPRLLVSGGWKTLLDELLKIIPEKKRLSQANVTKLEVQDGKVMSAIINGEMTLTAERFVYTFSPGALKSLLPIDAVSGKTIQKIAKTEPFTALSIDIACSTSMTNIKNMVVLQDTTEENFFVVGQFVTNADPLREKAGLQISTWLTLIDAESALNDEIVSKAIKTMKKMIKRAFPLIIEKTSWERILSVPQAIGRFDQLSLEKNSTLPDLKNLYICGGQIKGHGNNTAGAIQSALHVANAIEKKSTNAFYKVEVAQEEEPLDTEI